MNSCNGPFAEFNAIIWKTYNTFSAFDAFTRFWSEIERLVLVAAESAEKNDADQYQLSSGDEAADYFHARRMARHLHDEVVTPSFRYSAVITLFATIERELKRFADNLAKERQHEIGFRDLRGGLLQQISRYLEAYHGFALSTLSGYNEIRRLQRVRNCLVHALGEPSLVPEGERKALLAIHRPEEGIEIHEGMPIEIHPRFVELSLKAGRCLFYELFARVDWSVNDRWKRTK